MFSRSLICVRPFVRAFAAKAKSKAAPSEKKAPVPRVIPPPAQPANPPPISFGEALRAQRMRYLEETRRQQQQQSQAAQDNLKPAVDPLKHAPSVQIQKIQVVKKSRSVEALAAALARNDSDARFHKEKLLDLAVQSRSWMRDVATVEKAIDTAFASPPSGFPAAVLYSRAVRFNEKHNLVPNRSDSPVVSTHDSNILSKDAFDADGSGRA